MQNTIFLTNKTISRFSGFHKEIQTEVLRKTIHMSASLVPALVRISPEFTVAMLSSCSIIYLLIQMRSFSGLNSVFFSDIIRAATRKNTGDKLDLGPLTLVMGIFLSLILFPEPFSDIAIYTLAFGDGMASLVGKTFGKIRLPFTGGKTLAGSFACFLMVLLVSFRLTNRIGFSVILGLAAAFVEVLPLKALDNIFLPVCTGSLALIL